MDKGKAISRFLEQVDSFPQVVLVTDDEVKQLFGDEVAVALRELHVYSLEKKVCNGCGGICCRDVGCELYASQFVQCPIHDSRPIVCRLHFCRRFEDADKSQIIALRDIFLGCYRAVDLWDSANLRSMDIPPLLQVCPDFIRPVLPSLEEVRQHRLDPQLAVQLIRQQARRYRSSHSRGKK